MANLAETCHPDNPFQVMMDLQTEPNTTDDAAMLAENLPRLQERTGVKEMHTDSGYNSPAVDQVIRQYQVEQVPTAICGRQPNPDKLNLDDFTWEVDPQGQPLALTVPTGQRAEVEPGRQPDRSIARFTPSPPTSSVHMRQLKQYRSKFFCKFGFGSTIVGSFGIQVACWWS